MNYEYKSKLLWYLMNVETYRKLQLLFLKSQVRLGTYQAYLW